MRKPLIIFVLVALFIGYSCNTEQPDGIFDPDATAAPDPVITSVTPPDTAYGAADERSTVTIVGQNFGDDPSEVIVNFGSKKATIISHSATQMVVTPPANFTDSLRVMVSKFGSNAAYEFGVYEQPSGEFHPYKLLNPVEQVSGYDAYALPEAICVDGDGNLIVVHKGSIDRVDASGNIVTIGAIRGSRTENAQIGPDGALYYTYSKNIMKVDTVNFDATYKKLNETSLSFDFDQNDNLYAIDEKSIYSVDITTMEPTELITLNNEFPDTNLSSIRVYDGDLYIAGDVKDSTGVTKRYIWKMMLDSGAGTVTGDFIQVIDWSAMGYETILLNNFTFDESGQLLVATQNNAVLVVYPNGSDYATGEVKTLYGDILGSEYAHRIFWGTGNYLYISTFNVSDTENAKVLKVNMFGTGAPYYGRN